MANIANRRIGPCSLTYKGTDIGNTLGGVKFTYERKLTDLKVDRYGETPVDAVVTGTTLKIAFKVAEPVAAILQPFVPEGTNLSGANGQQVGLAAGEGASMRNSAGLLVLHPLDRAASDLSEDVNVYLAYPSGNVDLNLEVANQRVFAVEMAALVNEAFTPGKRLGHVGPTNLS